MKAWKHTVGTVIATYFEWNQAWSCVMTFKKQSIVALNGQTFRKSLLTAQDHNFSHGTGPGPGNFHTHACEALVTQSTNVRFARRLNLSIFNKHSSKWRHKHMSKECRTKRCWITLIIQLDVLRPQQITKLSLVIIKVTRKLPMDPEGVENVFLTLRMTRYFPRPRDPLVIPSGLCLFLGIIW